MVEQEYIPTLLDLYKCFFLTFPTEIISQVRANKLWEFRLLVNAEDSESLC